jgi:hypothetical protein
MSRIVPFKELQELSGYRKPGPLRRWLVERKIEFVTDRLGNQEGIRVDVSAGSAASVGIRPNEDWQFEHGRRC